MGHPIMVNRTEVALEPELVFADSQSRQKAIGHLTLLVCPFVYRIGICIYRALNILLRAQSPFRDEAGFVGSILGYS